jgi:tRNA(fMet)-specific endonuclease VapC
MTLYLLDTDWIADVLTGQESATQTLLALASAGLALSIITYGELYEGAYYARDPAAALEGLHTFLEGKELLPLTLKVMERFAKVRGALPRRIRQQIGDMDLLIGATALEHELTLLTRNLKHFQHIPDLKLYQPS